MNKDIQELFPTGEENTAYAQDFIGQSYLNMLTTKPLGVGNVTLSLIHICSLSHVSAAGR